MHWRSYPNYLENRQYPEVIWRELNIIKSDQQLPSRDRSIPARRCYSQYRSLFIAH